MELDYVLQREKEHLSYYNSLMKTKNKINTLNAENKSALWK
jgi:hypothetical protein